MLRRRQRERIFEDMVGLGEAFPNIAAVELKVRADVGAFDRLYLGEIGKAGSRQFDRVVDQRRAWFNASLHVEHRRQLLVIDFDQAQRLFRGIDGQCRHRRHRIADVTHFFHGDNGLIFENRAVIRLDAFVVQDIVAREHRHHAGDFESFGNIDALDARVRVRAAENLAVTHAGDAHVGEIARSAGHFGLVIEPAHRFADCRSYLHRLSSSHAGGRGGRYFNPPRSYRCTIS